MLVAYGIGLRSICLRRQVVGAKRSARSRCLKWQDADLIITVTLEWHIVRRRPLFGSDLPLADREAPVEDFIMAHPFGLANAATVYQEASQR